MSEKQGESYEQEKNSLRNILLQQPENKDRYHMFSILNGILRLRQLACHPQLIFPDFDGVSGKTEQIIDTFDTLRSEGHKVLIFSSFVRHLEILAEVFRQRGWKYALLTGSTNNRPSEIAIMYLSSILGGILLPSHKPSPVHIVSVRINRLSPIVLSLRIVSKKRFSNYRRTRGGWQKHLLRIVRHCLH